MIANVTEYYTLNIFSDKVILFVSDGNPTDEKDEILRVISEQNARLGNTVHIQTFGVGKGKGSSMVGSPATLRLKCNFTCISIC